MKRKLWLLFIVVLFFLGGCTVTNDTKNLPLDKKSERIGEEEKKNNDEKEVPVLTPLSEELEKEIKQDWLRQFGTPFYYDNYYGTYDGSVTFFVPGDACVIKNIIISDTIFRYNYDWEIYVWNNGDFSGIVSAFNEGLLKAEDIKDIGYYHAEFIKKEWQVSEEDFNKWYFNPDDIDVQPDSTSQSDDKKDSQRKIYPVLYYANFGENFTLDSDNYRFIAINDSHQLVALMNTMVYPIPWYDSSPYYYQSCKQYFPNNDIGSFYGEDESLFSSETDIEEWFIQNRLIYCSITTYSSGYQSEVYFATDENNQVGLIFDKFNNFGGAGDTEIKTFNIFVPVPTENFENLSITLDGELVEPEGKTANNTKIPAKGIMLSQYQPTSYRDEDIVLIQSVETLNYFLGDYLENKYNNEYFKTHDLLLVFFRTCSSELYNGGGIDFNHIEIDEAGRQCFIVFNISSPHINTEDFIVVPFIIEINRDQLPMINGNTEFRVNVINRLSKYRGSYHYLRYPE